MKTTFQVITKDAILTIDDFVAPSTMAPGGDTTLSQKEKKKRRKNQRRKQNKKKKKKKAAESKAKTG